MARDAAPLILGCGALLCAAALVAAVVAGHALLRREQELPVDGQSTPPVPSPSVEVPDGGLEPAHADGAPPSPTPGPEAPPPASDASAAEPERVRRGRLTVRSPVPGIVYVDDSALGTPDASLDAPCGPRIVRLARGRGVDARPIEWLSVARTVRVPCGGDVEVSLHVPARSVSANVSVDSQEPSDANVLRTLQSRFQLCHQGARASEVPPPTRVTLRVFVDARGSATSISTDPEPTASPADPPGCIRNWVARSRFLGGAPRVVDVAIGFTGAYDTSMSAPPGRR